MREGEIGREMNFVNALQRCTLIFSEWYVRRYEKDVPDVIKANEGKIDFKGLMDRDVDFTPKPRMKSL